tara:strand:- start:2533 stop:3768 length:1236 start_codon:yes stop_codon:yes gene_type:complete
MNSLEYAMSLDNQDNLSDAKELFHIPKSTTYLCGHSLGLQPKKTSEFINQELEDWKNLGVLGHFEAKNPWYPYHEFLNKQSANIVGALQEEVVVMNSLTVNLHLLLTSFYNPKGSKNKIIIDTPCFPSDRYAVNSHIKNKNLNIQKTLIELTPKNGKNYLENDYIINQIEKHGNETHLILLSGVNYYNGQYYDIDLISKKAKEYDCIIGLDLAHAVGNVKLFLHDWDIDFAIWCGYKYLNGGPGAPGSAFINKKYLRKDIKRLEGWWGHNKESRFELKNTFETSNTAESWQLSNPPIFSMAALWSSLNIFDEIGMDSISLKSIKLTSYLYTLLSNIPDVEILTPKNQDSRGAQLSIRLKKFDKKIYNKLIINRFICDFRSPDILRIAPAPLYNSFEDVYNFSQFLNSLIND